MHCKADSLTTGPPGKSPSLFLSRPLSSTGHSSPGRAFAALCVCLDADSFCWLDSGFSSPLVCHPSRSDGNLLLSKASPILAGPIGSLPLFGQSSAYSYGSCTFTRGRKTHLIYFYALVCSRSSVNPAGVMIQILKGRREALLSLLILQITKLVG